MAAATLRSLLITNENRARGDVSALLNSEPKPTFSFCYMPALIRKASGC
jgi:hypothetical protein